MDTLDLEHIIDAVGRETYRLACEEASDKSGSPRHTYILRNFSYSPVIQ
jgi:hypothetical protein